jgi:hypothetical protein
MSICVVFLKKIYSKLCKNSFTASYVKIVEMYMVV